MMEILKNICNMDTYEKKYKEIVGQLKKAYLYAQTDSTKAVLEEIFPELKESEDERIRKEIARFILIEVEDEIVGNKWIAWLEKQGEKKSQRMISAEAKEAMYDKPSWSEKDEQHIDSLLKRLDGLCRNEFERTRFAISEDRDWLTSLKERIGW